MGDVLGLFCLIWLGFSGLAWVLRCFVFLFVDWCSFCFDLLNCFGINWYVIRFGVFGCLIDSVGLGDLR